MVAKTLFTVFYASAFIGIVYGSLQKMSIISNSNEALCCNREKAVYYLEENSIDDWVIFLEGGGGCTSVEECNARYNNTETRILMEPITHAFIEGRDLLSNDSTQNPSFYNFSHILIPYCSQDAFLANSRLPPSSVSLGDPDNISFVFRGRVILESIITDLLPLGLANASRVVLAGSSAGGVGIFNNLEWIRNQLNPSVQLSVIIDSSWFIPYNDYHAINFSNETTVNFNITSQACNDFTFGFPCCTSLACLLRNDNYTSRSLPPTFVITSLYDIFTLNESLTEIIKLFNFAEDANVNDYDFLHIFNEYGALMRSTLWETFALRNSLTIFAPSCTQHVYLATSSLWDESGPLSATVDSPYHADPFVIKNPVQAGRWNQVEINMTTNGSNIKLISLHQSIQDWYNDKNTHKLYMDVCNGPACDRQCPSIIALQFSYEFWPREIIITVLVISAIMAATPLIIKIFLYLCMKHMQYRQRLYVYNLNRTQHKKPKFPKALHAVSVSCTGLHYLLDTTEAKKPEVEQLPNATEVHHSHYRLAAFANTFLPCCKPACHRYNAPVGDSESGQGNTKNRSSSIYHTLRPDSGISSSISSSVTRSGNDYSDTTSMDYIIDTNSPQDTPVHKRVSRPRKKVILKRVNMYVNPGELLAIMGPSGSGKTTLLDVLLGRRRTGRVQGDRFVNGIPLLKMRDWFIMNTGYVRQLATSFYNELTVRENLLFSMNMQAPSHMSLAQKLERVEQVIQETGLQEQADLVVGSGIGLGLSGGQRKRLTIAVQLLSMPNIIFLDEPTSGLDSASSLDILKSLQVMAGTGRAIVVTIHQPRSEIFHAFDKILLLCNGQVAFFGSPVKVWDFFQKAIINEEVEKHEGQVQDQILDHLKEKKSQEQVLNAYNKSLEPKKVRSAVLEGTEDTDSAPLQVKQKRDPGLWQRLVSLESRASLRQNLFTIIYLPVVYTLFGALLGTTYLETESPVQVMSVICVLSCSSALFMSSIVLSLLVEPLKLFQLEHSDGISRSYELILQVYIRMSFVGTLPLSICATLVFLLVYLQDNFEVYAIVLILFLLVNQVWISIFILLTVLAPTQAHRLCPVFAAIGGFWCGFIVPKPLMPPYYSWIFYINPSFYAYSATSVTVLNQLESACSRDSPLECFRTSGFAALSQFGIVNVNPFQNMLILIGMTLTVLILAVMVLQLKVSYSLIKEHVKNWVHSCDKKRKESETKIDASTENLDELDTSVQLRGFRRNRLPGQNKEIIQQEKEAIFSSPFIESNQHQVFHNFPWERITPDEGDVFDVETNLFSPHSSSSRPSRIVSDGSESVFESPELITMTEEEDQEARRKLAEQKWEARRLKIETEIRRLREANLHRKAAQRHSIASFGDGLEDEIFERKESLPRKRYLSTANHSQVVDQSTGDLGIKTTLQPKERLKEKPPFLRVKSLPAAGALIKKMAGVPPTLDTYDEEDDEMMGLPPKDIPHLRESMENMETIDYEDIPPQRLSDVPSSQESSPGKCSQV